MDSAGISRLFDTHVHFDGFPPEDLDSVLDRASGAGVDRMIAVGGSNSANELACRVAQAHADRVFAAVGYDRDCALLECDIDELGRGISAADPARRPVAIGEIGLDFHYLAETAREQQDLFARQLDLACRLSLPVIVHSREAASETLALLKKHVDSWKGSEHRIGVAHCFTEELSVAKTLLDLGMYIGFTGIVTFRKARDLREVAAYVPSGSYLLETDSPLLAPEPYRGGKNEPSYLVEVAKAVAASRSCLVEEVAETSTANACRLFGLNETGSSLNFSLVAAPPAHI